MIDRRRPAVAASGTGKVSVAGVSKSKVRLCFRYENRIKMMRKPAYYSTGMSKYWARHGFRLL
jgi:hypothetical protein